MVASSRGDRGRASGVLLALGLALLLWHAPARARCADVLPSPGQVTSTMRPVTARDLVGIRDIGSPDAAARDIPSPLAVSPDGTRVSFVLSRADPDANRYCRVLVVLPLEPGARPIVVDTGGDYIGTQQVVRDLFVDVGTPTTVTPAWSPDGRKIVYLKRTGGSTQVWLAQADGSGATQITHAPFDIEEIAWPDASAMPLVRGRPGMVAASRDIDKEGLSGWLYDARVETNSGPRPQVRAEQAPLETFGLDVERRTLFPASAAQDRLFQQQARESAGEEAIALDGRRAWTEQASQPVLSPRQLRATMTDGAVVRCSADACSGSILGLWWDRTGRTVVFLRHEGWDNERVGVYRWRPGSSPTRVLSSTAAIQGCVPAALELVCTRETSTTPRQVILLDPATGFWTSLFDPNPEFRHIALGSVERLRWRNDLGLEAWGDLVLPPDYRSGAKLPMIVVQYHSRGFLRGGTNDEYPIWLFAAHGFAVLSLERPTVVASLHPELTSVEALNRANYRGWAEHRSLLSSLVTGVRAALATGEIDRTRLGITGLSDGATLTRFALLNTHLFSAAAISTCCLEPKTVMTYGGIAWAEYNREMGFPAASVHDPQFWRSMSMAQNAARMDTPLLMQLADDEYLLALEAFEALREHHQPVEMYVFPNEHHGKWQPAHRLAIYERNIDWFAFWLQNREDPAPEKQTQYERWETMRTAKTHKASAREPTLRHRPAA